jgi:hypothetical protein
MKFSYSYFHFTSLKAVSVVLTGILSQILFGTTLTTLYGMGMGVVIVAVVLYNGSGFDDFCF